jgi:hypothetical protein
MLHVVPIPTISNDASSVTCDACCNFYNSKNMYCVLIKQCYIGVSSTQPTQGDNMELLTLIIGWGIIAGLASIPICMIYGDYQQSKYWEGKK